MTDEATIRQVFNDEEFVKGLFALETPEAVQAALRGRDVEMTMEEIRQVRELLVKRLETGEELTEEELTQVAGGVIIAGGTIALVLVLSFAVGALVTGGVGTVGALITQIETKGQW